jgi:hypothetical protein
MRSIWRKAASGLGASLQRHSIATPRQLYQAIAWKKLGADNEASSKNFPSVQENPPGKGELYENLPVVFIVLTNLLEN